MARALSGLERTCWAVLLQASVEQERAVERILEVLERRALTWGPCLPAEGHSKRVPRMKLTKKKVGQLAANCRVKTRKSKFG